MSEAEVLSPTKAPATRKGSVQRMDRGRREATPTNPLQMLNTAIEKGVSTDVLEKLIALHERFEATEARKAFNNAVADAKAEIPVIEKTQHVTFDHRSGDGQTDYWHEDLATIAKTIDPILGAHGLSYRYRSAQADGRVIVTCILSHRLGYSEETTLTAAPDASGKKNTIQQVGSTITYLQRYTLKLALGLAAGRDDDGVSSGEPVEALGDDQLRNLNELIDVAIDRGNWQRADYVRRFLTHMRVERIEDIPPSGYKKAVSAINSTMGS